MITDFVSKSIAKALRFSPTKGQQLLIVALAEFVTGTNENTVFLLKGYAGTGKTSVVSALVNSLAEFNLKTVLLAPTGRAAKVLTYYSGQSAFTIHKKIYRQKQSTDGLGKFLINQNLHKNTIFIVDEASMISNSPTTGNVFGSGYLLDDLFDFVNSGDNCKLMLIGDTAQLPPVGVSVSVALDAEYLRKTFFKQVIEVFLDEVVRQEKKSGVLANATQLRRLLANNDLKQPKFTLKNFTDIRSIKGRELLETISESYDRNGLENSIVLCRSNKMANRYNTGIRNAILYREEEISAGDMLMVVKNNYFWLEGFDDIDFIANGDIVEVERISKYEERYGFRFVTAQIRFVDYKDVEAEVKIMLDTLMHEGPALTSEQNLALYRNVAADYPEIHNKKQLYKEIKKNEYFNALQVKFAYAVTCHKAQGGQWKNVFIDLSYAPPIDVDFVRWLYTAVTRSSSNLYLVNFPAEYFDEEVV